MADPINFSTSELDYDGIVRALRNYLSYQSEFKDYNFQGSALSTLLSVLAYNTHYNAIYDNFAINEAFLDSAHKRESVISHASLLNYVPRSAHGAEAIVNFTVYDSRFDSTLTSVTLPKYSVFTTSVNGTQYTFYSDSAYTLQRNNSTFTAAGVHLRQGTYITIQRTYDTDDYQSIVLDNTNVDTSTITVRVTSQQITYTFTRAENILDVDDTSRVYFLSTDSHGRYRIEFGSGILGYQLHAGDIIEVTYLAVGDNPTIANGASIFTYHDSLTALGFTNTASATVTTTQRASGGQNPQSTESIRFLAPKIFTTQNRCITANDYKSMIIANFDFVQAVNVWGGQDSDPPEYGKVLISIIPTNHGELTTYQKNSILTLLNAKKELTKLIEFVDPTYLNVAINTTVHYRSSLSSNTSVDIATIVRDAIKQYGNQQLSEFGSMIRFSQLSEVIDNAEDSIVSNTTKLTLSADITPVYNTSYTYTVTIGNPIYKTDGPTDNVSSSGFYCSDQGDDVVCYLDDDPSSGKLRLYKRGNNDEKIIIRNCGTVDYDSGTITIDDINITSTSEGTLTITVNPSSYDVVTIRNQFAVIDDSQLTIDVIDDDQSATYVQTSIK